MFLSFRKKPKDLFEISEKLSESLSQLRLTYCLTLPVVMKISQADFTTGKNMYLQPGFQERYKLDIPLLAFQLTNTIGFIFKQNYHTDIKGVFLMEERILTKTFNDLNELKECKKHNEEYLDCKGNIDCLESKLTADIIGRLRLENMKNSLSIIRESIQPIGIWSQASLAEAFGDTKTATKLKRLSIH